MDDDKPCEARPKADVLSEVMDVCRSKSEHEWIAAREIESLRARNAELAAKCEWLKGALDFVPDEIPTSWLDPLLSGPKAIDVGGHPGTEKLLMALKERLRVYVKKALNTSPEDAE